MFKKIILVGLLLAVVVYASSHVYISQKKSLAQVVGTITSGSIPDTRFPIGSQVRFILNTNQPVSIGQINIELTPINSAEGTTRKNIFLTPEIANENVYVARIPDSAELGTYSVQVKNNNAVLWNFNESVEVVNRQEIFTPKTLTPTENEQRVTAFTFSVSADTKDPTLFHFEWGGAGRGISFGEVKGTGSKLVKQMVYTNLYPLDDSGLKDMIPFFSLPNEGVGETGKGDIRLVNTTNKEQTFDVVIAPKGEDGSPAVNYAKTMTVKVPPSTPKIQSLSKPKNKLKSGDVIIAQFAPGIPFPQLSAPLRTSDTVSLTMIKTGKGQKPILLDQPKLTMENTMIFTVPVSIVPGVYKLTLKTYFGVTSYDVQVVK